MLGYVVWTLDDIILCSVAIPSNNVFVIATQSNMSFEFIDVLVVCAIFGFLLVGFGRIRLTLCQFSFCFVRRNVTIVKSHIFVDASATWMHKPFVIVCTHSLRGL